MDTKIYYYHCVIQDVHEDDSYRLMKMTNNYVMREGNWNRWMSASCECWEITWRWQTVEGGKWRASKANGESFGETTWWGSRQAGGRGWQHVTRQVEWWERGVVHHVVHHGARGVKYVCVVGEGVLHICEGGWGCGTFAGGSGGVWRVCGVVWHDGEGVEGLGSLDG